MSWALALLVAGLGWLAVGPSRFPWRVTALGRHATRGPSGPVHPAPRSRPRRQASTARRPRRAVGPALRPRRAVGPARRPRRQVDTARDPRRAVGPARRSRRQVGSDRLARRPGPAARAGSVDEVAVAADLLAVATAAGCSVHEAVLGAGEACGPGSPLAEAAAALRHGGALEEVLDRLARHPPSGWHTLATTLGVSAASGAPAGGVLCRLAAQERTRARRDRERRARRLPVVLLLPLVGLVLPSFVLVTLVPVALSGAASLQLPPTEATTESQEEP